MENEQLITADELCFHYNMDQSFIEALNEAGLIQVTTVEEKCFVHPSQLHDLERFSRMHYELQINIEGIEAIAHLLKRVEQMQNEMNQLASRLKIYTSD